MAGLVGCPPGRAGLWQRTMCGGNRELIAGAGFECHRQCDYCSDGGVSYRDRECARNEGNLSCPQKWESPYHSWN